MNVEFSKITRICRPVSAMNWIYSFHSGFKHLNWYLLEIPNSYRPQYCPWYVSARSIFISSPCCFSIILGYCFLLSCFLFLKPLPISFGRSVNLWISFLSTFIFALSRQTDIEIWYILYIPTECSSCRKQRRSCMDGPCLKDSTDSSGITKRVSNLGLMLDYIPKL